MRDSLQPMSSEPVGLLTESGLVFALAGFARLAGWAWFDPLIGRLPRTARLFFAAALTAALWPRWLAATPAEPALAGGIALVLEFGWGAALALSVHALFALVTVAVSTLTGTATGGLLWLCPPDEKATDHLDGAWRRLAFWLAALAFLAGSGHLLVVDALLASFDAMPVAGLPATAALETWIAAGGWLLLAGLKLALPLLAFVLIVNLAFALTLRREPGLDVWSFGLGLGALSLLGVWVALVPSVAVAMQAGLAQLGVWLLAVSGG